MCGGFVGLVNCGSCGSIVGFVGFVGFVILVIVFVFVIVIVVIVIVGCIVMGDTGWGRGEVDMTTTSIGGFGWATGVVVWRGRGGGRNIVFLLLLVGR